MKNKAIGTVIGAIVGDALILAVNLADDADTVGAVTGMIAGALYGVDDMPKEWVDCLVWSMEILDDVELLHTTGN